AIDVDEARIVGRVGTRTDIAINLVAARMLHGGGLTDLARILELADRRMIARDLAQTARIHAIESRIADMADGDLAILHHRDRGDTGHPAPIRAALGSFKDRVVGQRDGFANALLAS